MYKKIVGMDPRGLKLRVIYVSAMTVVIISLSWAMIVDVRLLLKINPNVSLSDLLKANFLVGAFEVVLAVCGLCLVGLIGFLIARPMGWGKLVLVVRAVAWGFHSAVGIAIGLGTVGQFAPLIAAASLLFALAVAHQIVQPRLFGA
jgi:hypothetical protein